jgi:3-phenylpropionate/trans-cinnamate dioxygenase ferredoxin reductase subunit
MSDINTSCFRIVIVGTGHAGAQAAIALRQRGFAGSIVLVSEEHSLPYERPPLSKDYLSGSKTFERLLIRPAAFWQERNIEFALGKRVIRVEPTGHWLEAHDGSRFAYEKLIWAGGGHARKLTCDGYDLEGVHGVRSRTDVDRLIAELEVANRVVVIGGGLEAAAVLTKLRKVVTVVEASPSYAPG